MIDQNNLQTRWDLLDSKSELILIMQPSVWKSSVDLKTSSLQVQLLSFSNAYSI